MVAQALAPGLDPGLGDDARLVFVDDETPPMTFPGTWGAKDVAVLSNSRTQELGKPGAGPRTPSLQALWTDPPETIFCSKTWDGPRGCKD